MSRPRRRNCSRAGNVPAKCAGYFSCTVRGSSEWDFTEINRKADFGSAFSVFGLTDSDRNVFPAFEVFTRNPLSQCSRPSILMLPE